jgi:hypothetical protein
MRRGRYSVDREGLVGLAASLLSQAERSKDRHFRSELFQVLQQLRNVAVKLVPSSDGGAHH